MTGSRVIVGAQAVAVIGLLVMAMAAAEKRATSPPEIRSGAPVVPRCPAPDSDDYFYADNALFPRHQSADADTRAYLSQLLRAAEASPLWCGARPDVAYRLMLVFEWGRTKVITMHRTRGVWMLDAVEFRHSSVARFSVDRRESRPLSSEDAASVTTTLEADRFWRLPSNEPEQPQGIYDGPHWFVEGRSAGTYHLVLRAWDRDQIIRSARRLMQLAHMTG